MNTNENLGVKDRIFYMNNITPYSELHNLPRIDLAHQIPLHHPISVNFEPTNVCNFKCTFCPESFPDYKEKAGGLSMLSFPDFQRIARQFKEFGRLKVLKFFVMGEPFVNKRLLDFIVEAKSLDITDRVMVSSNGTLITPEKYHGICYSQMDYLRVSIYGGNAEQQAKRTQSKIPLEKIKENIAGLKAYRDANCLSHPFIYLKIVTDDPAEAEYFMSWAAKISDEAQIEPIHNWHDENIKLAGVDTETLVQGKYFKNKKEVCPFPFFTLVIHSDLRVGVCCVDWDKSIVVGDLNKQTIQEVWNGEPLRELQRKHLERRRKEVPACANCTFIHAAVDNIDALPFPSA